MAPRVGVPVAIGDPVLVSTEVAAAGGVVVRGAPGARELLIVHRPHYDDWTHPKGKLARGESFEDAALREIEEETGFRCIPGAELPEVRYLDAQRRPKVVRYWLMQPVGEGAYEPNDEVDAIRWVVPDEARGLLSYPRELDTLEAALALDEPVYLVRHGKAGARAMWTGRDDDRPLTGKGLRQAERLPAQLALDDVRRVVSSRARRCVDTVAPLALALGVSVELDARLREGAPAEEALECLRTLGGPAVACTHGDVFRAIVEPVIAERPAEGSYGWKKGATWALERDAGTIVGARYIAPPRDRVR